MPCWVFFFLYRRRRGKQWRGHPANHYHHPCRWSHWDLQDDWQRGPGIDMALLLRLPFITYCSTNPLPYICNQRGFCLYIAWPWKGISSPPCMSLAVPQFLPSTWHHAHGCVIITCQSVPKVPIVPPKVEYYQHSYQSFSFHWLFFFTFLHFILVCKCCTMLLTQSQVLKSCFINKTHCKETSFLVISCISHQSHTCQIQCS